MNTFKRNIIIGWRNILKNKVVSLINITGVAIAIAVSSLILFWVVDELNFDKFHKRLDHIYTVYEHQQFSDGHELYTHCTPFPLAKELKSNFAEVLNATTFTNVGEMKLPVKVDNKEFKEGPIVFADEEFLNVFSFELLSGDKNALKTKDQILITDKLATKLFGEQSPIGKVINLLGEHTFQIGGIIKDPGNQSSIKFNIIAPLLCLETYGADFTSWNNNWPRTSIVVKEGTNIDSFNKKIIGILNEKAQDTTKLYTFPFKDERLYNYSGKSNRIQYVYQFIAIAFIIILIASINFINFSTAQSEKRSLEVGTRKSMGANRLTIIIQFLYENGLIIGLSVMLGFMLTTSLTPIFNQVTDKSISFSILSNPNLLFMMVGLLLVILFLSITYPALHLSSGNPVDVLKRGVFNKKSSFSLRSLLVVVQFGLSIVLIVCTIGVTSQLNYMNNYDLGYSNENLVYIELGARGKDKYKALEQELNNISGLVNLSKTDKLPFIGGNSSWGFGWQGKDPDKNVLICKMHVDHNYFKTLGIKFEKGKSFSKLYGDVVNKDHKYNEVILNKEAIRRMEMDDPIDKYFQIKEEHRPNIVGVIDDFHFESLRSSIEPLLLMPLTSEPMYFIMRVQSNNLSQTLANVKGAWEKVVPDTNLELGFFNDRLQQMYNFETRVSKLFTYFSFVAIFIACIGLFGISLYIIELKRKEIGIRKVNGAKITEVLVILNKRFFGWVVTSFVIACPVAYFVMNKWLENFAYKTEISWWIFALAGLLAFGIALLTVSWQSWKAATRNPVDVLRYE